MPGVRHAKVTTYQITKFDAIRSQFDAAIEMFFLSENFVATHTLAAAAYNTLRDIATRQSEEHPFLKRGYLDSLDEAERRGTLSRLNGPENFFKHANRDPDARFDFNTELTELLLTDAMAYFRDKPELRPRHYDIFRLWVGEIKENADLDPQLRELVDRFGMSLRSKGKPEFWRLGHLVIQGWRSRHGDA
jgi:hypothetical protein